MLDHPHPHETPDQRHPPDLPERASEWPMADARLAAVPRLQDSGAPLPPTALARVAALSRLLGRRQPGGAALAEALRLGAELVPEAARVALLVPDERWPAQLVEIAYAMRAAPGGSVRAEHRAEPARVDVLSERLSCRVLAGDDVVCRDGLRCQPLRSPRGSLLGALTVQGARALSVHSKDALSILADHLAALLERQRAERTREGLGRAVAVLDRSVRRALETQPDATGRQDARALRSLAGALRVLPGVDGALALVPLPGGRLRALAPHRATRELERPASRRVLAAVSGAGRGHALELRAGSAEWEAAAPLVPLLAGASQPDPERLLLLPVRATTAWMALVALAVQRQDALLWLPDAQVFCLAVGERIAAGRAQAAREAQGRDYDAFLSLMAHELRSPLTAVKGYAQLLVRQARRNAPPETALRSAEAVEQQAARLSEMLDELHDAARIRRNRLELLTGTTDLAPIVRQQVERWRHLSADHEYRLLMRDDERLIGEWDAHRVAQVVRDLLDNATRFCPRGGVVEIELRREGEAALLIVRDTGIGIAPAERERIFAYRYRAREAEARNLAGLGLGLFVSRTVTERLGGRLWLQESHVGKGSEFRLRLPLVSETSRTSR